jgi:GNAT superfamily N-acetyltransferase
MKIKKTVIASKCVKFEIRQGQVQIGRAFLYIVKNDLHERPYGFLEDLFVDENYRSQGLGKRLLFAAVKEAKKRKLYKLIGTSRTFRTQIHKFYEKYGFKKYGFEFRINL